MKHPVSGLLQQLEAIMSDLALWQDHPIDPAALASVEPFCIDTMTFVQWLQFVFIPRLNALIEAGANLPKGSSIAPLAEEYFKADLMKAKGCIDCLKAIDAQLNAD